MRILIAEDDLVSRRVLQKNIEMWGHEVLVAKDGLEAWKMFIENKLQMVISDWMMPQMDGLTLCRKIRAANKSDYVYIILLTAKGRKEDIIEGMNAGADDYVTKPFDREELYVRIKAGERIVSLEQQLAKQIQELQEALAHVKRLQGLVPICASCKKIRDDKGYWSEVESYIQEHSDAVFSHSLCPECAKKLYPELYNGKTKSNVSETK